MQINLRELYIKIDSTADEAEEDYLSDSYFDNCSSSSAFWSYIEKLVSSQKKKLQVTFCGENLILLWDAVLTIYNRIQNMNAACPVSFSIVTDGMGIDDEIVSYLNMNNIGVVLSWDGRNSAKTTGFDIMDMNWNVLKNINFLYLQGVLSKYALPKDWCDDAAPYFNEWKDLHQRDLFLNMEHANRYGRNNEMFKGIDFRELRKQIIWLMDHMAVATDDAYTCLYKNLFNEIAITKGSNGIDCRCGNGLLVQTIDLAGNLYFCKEANTPMIRADESVSDIVKNPF